MSLARRKAQPWPPRCAKSGALNKHSGTTRSACRHGSAANEHGTMKPVKICTAASIFLIAQGAPQVLAAGDSNLDSGVGSAASRGSFGYNANYEPMYDTPANDYGVWRDAYGGLRDRGMIPDNLTTRVPE